MSSTGGNWMTNKRRRVSSSAVLPHEVLAIEGLQHSQDVYDASEPVTSSPVVPTLLAKPICSIPSVSSSTESLCGTNSSSDIVCSVSTYKNQTHSMTDTVERKSHNFLSCERNNYYIVVHKSQECCVRIDYNIFDNKSHDHERCLRNDQHLFKAINSKKLREALTLLWRGSSFTREALNQALISFSRPGLFLVESLVQAGANIEHQDELGNTPLMICAENGSMDILDFLVHRHANVNAVNFAGNTALILTVSRGGRAEETRFLLKQKDVDIHHENQQGQTALNKATLLLDANKMRLLLEESMRRNTIQRNVSKIGHDTDSCFFTNRYQEVKQNFTAAKTGFRKMYEFLKRSLISGESPLELAIEAGDITAFHTFLYRKFPSEELERRYFDSALMCVFEKSWHKSAERFSSTDIEFIRFLLRCKADVNQDNGTTKLISLAVESGNYEVVELLCTHGADINKFSSNGQDLLDIAARNGCADLAELLLKYKTRKRTGFAWERS